MTGSSELYDVFYVTDRDGEQEDVTYVDTLDVGQFATAGGILRQVASYYPDEEEPPEKEVEVEDEEEEPSSTFQ